ncbi:hypothetical protein [Natronococcus occultus]|uniref:Lipoprotein n=1 Tax=Natronococcus occultus SP4 TaxID=694430 RepID=L0K399_9EURY|nr:hypothetical protein [Natronococcus occultus]AGB38804.1 hypothetical protein Natoc_3060 [Natronococcus occultus SP4]
MDRRHVLLGSGTALATVLAGCSGSMSGREEAASDEKRETDDSKTKRDDEQSKTKEDDEKRSDEKPDKQKEEAKIPGFDRAKCYVESDVVRIKEIAYSDRCLDLQVMLKTSDRETLRKELRALAPGLARGIRDAEAFLAEVKEIKFTLYDKHKNRLVALYLDVARLRKYLDGDLTNDELVDRLLDGLDHR